MSDMFSSGVNRTFGLSGSGIDVDSMVQQLMKTARKPYDSLQQKETVLEWKKSDYYTMYTSINDFRNNKVFNFNMKSTLDAKAVTSSNTNVATITANGDAINVNHTLSVSQLASGVTQSSSEAITSGKSKTSLASQFGISGKFNLTINGKQIAVDSSKSINDLVSSINKADAGVTALYDTNQDRFYLYTTGMGSSAKIDFTGTNTQGLNFLANNLKLSAVSAVNTSGISSGGYLGTTDMLPVAGQFAGLAGSFNLKLKAAGTEEIIAVDTAKTTLNDIVTQINNLKDASGNQLASATIGTDGKLTIKSASDTNTLDMSGSDAAGLSFLQTQLQMSSVSDWSAIGNTTNVATSANAVVFDQTSMLATSFSSAYTGTFNLSISDGTTTKALAVNTQSMSMADLVNNINNLKDANGKQLAIASFDHGKFSIKAAQTGATVDLSGSDSAALSYLTNTLQLTNQQGQDAAFKLDGVTMTQVKNNFTVAGVTYNLLSTGSTNITVQNDVDKIVNSVKTFISDYNALLASVTTKVTEAYDRNYLPLTDDQKSAMKDDDISLWTTKAKTGLLHSDSILQTLTNSMRDAFSSSVSGVDGKYKTATSLGITTSVDWTENGKLYLDETTLRTALQNDPDVVYKLFSTDGADTAHDGIAVRLNDALKTATTSISTEAGTTASITSDTSSVLGKQAKDYQTQLTDLFKKLQTKENDYYKQYSSMETALSKLSQQTSQLSSLLGS